MSPRAWRWSLPLLLAGFAAFAFSALRIATDASWQDTEAFLGHGLYIAEHGGVWGALRDSFNGSFPIVERHPLYLAMLSTFAERTPEYFFNAKLLNLACGTLLLAVFVWMVARRYGRGPGLLAGLLYAVSSSLVTASSHVNHETQFTLLTLCTWWFLTGGSRAPQVAAGATGAGADDVPQSTARWALAGAFLGLAFLTKSPAALIGVAIVAAGLWRQRLDFLAHPRVWVLIAMTGLLSAPLLVRNLIAFGTPVYEGMNSSISWFDDWGELGKEHSVLHYDRYGITTIEKNGLPTAADYWRSHSVLQIGKRLLKGVVHEAGVVSRDALSPPYPLPRIVAAAWGYVVLALVVIGWWRRRRSFEGALVFFWTAAFFAFFGWDYMFPDLRYLAPLVPVWLALAAPVGWGLLQRLLRRPFASRAMVLGCALLAISTCGWTAANLLRGEAHPKLYVSPSYASLIEWLNAHGQEGDRILLGPTSDFYGLIWLVERPIAVIQMPSVDTLDAFQRYLRERRVRYFMMNTENLYGSGRRLEAAMQPYAGLAADGSIVEHQPLPGWRRVFEDPSVPRRFYIYESAAFAGSPAAAMPQPAAPVAAAGAVTGG
ncbi:MAG: glycosyltransferase family 39 protein [Steroidobacteraceae bacterium]